MTVIIMIIHSFALNEQEAALDEFRKFATDHKVHLTLASVKLVTPSWICINQSDERNQKVASVSLLTRYINQCKLTYLLTYLPAT